MLNVCHLGHKIETTMKFQNTLQTPNVNKITQDCSNILRVKQAFRTQTKTANNNGNSKSPNGYIHRILQRLGCCIRQLRFRMNLNFKIIGKNKNTYQTFFTKLMTDFTWSSKKENLKTKNGCNNIGVRTHQKCKNKRFWITLAKKKIYQTAQK